MTVNSATIGAEWFLNGLATLQSEQLKTQQQLSSGFAVSSAADDPAATQNLVDLGSSLAAAQAYQSNLNGVQAEASAADTALSSAINLVQSAQSIASQGASSTATATERENLAVQIQGIQQQLVSIANTSVGGRYIFGGDEDQSAPYQYDASSTTGVDALTGGAPTRTIVNPNGEPVYQALAASTIFDPTSGATPSSDNTFAALQNLQTALGNNDSTGIANALAALGNAASWLNQQQVHYGIAEQRLTNEQNGVSTQITQLQSSIASIRDANVAQDATDLSRESVTEQAAIEAQSAVPQKSLFDYLA